MIFTRRMVGLAAALTLSFAAQAALAQELKIMAPAAPGGGWDATARSMQTALTASGIAKNVQVSNVPGAGGAIGLAQFVNTAKGDPNQLMVNGFVMVGSLITNKSPVNLSMVTPIARLTAEPLVIVVPAASPIQNAKGLVDAMKADIGKVTFAGGSAGGVDHILAGLLAGTIGLDGAKVNYVPFAGGGEALAALLSGRVTAGISGWGEFEGQVKAGKLRAIAISSDKRQDGINVPTLREEGVDVELFNWRGVFGAPGTTKAQQDALIGLFDKLVISAAWKTELTKRDWTGIYQRGEAFGKYVETETVRITAILKDLGLAT